MSWIGTFCRPNDAGSADALSFCDALIAIRKEADQVISGEQPRDNNVFKHAPHPMAVILDDKWDRCVACPQTQVNIADQACRNRPYSREKAVWPVTGLKRNKFWPSVCRVDDGMSHVHKRFPR